MSHSTNKVNPFYIQDDEEAWDDDYGDDEYGFEDYDDEQVMLINGNGGIKNRKYNDASAVSHVNHSDRRHHHQSAFGQQQHHNNFSRSYQDGRYDMHDRHRQHRPQLWKYGVILFAVIAVVVFGSSMSSESNGKTDNNVSLSSLMDEIPNDEYRIVVLGERHSGTVWMIERLRECFPHVEVSTNLQRMGFFFQDDEATARSKDEALDNNHNYDKDTIVVHVTLNVYDWLEQMRLSPEYAPDHVGTHKELGHVVPLGWEEFLSKPWTTERPPTDLTLANETGPVCQMAFHYNEVVSCAKTAGGIGDPMYELQPGGESGHPFESIIDLRAAKLKNHHSVQESWPSVKKMIQVSYETTAQDFKTKLLSEILEFTGWNGGSYDDNGATLPCSGNLLPPSLDSSNEMTLEFVEYVTKNADWYIEEGVASYVPWTQSEIAAKGIRPAPAESDEGSPDKDDETKKDADGDGDDEAEEEREIPADESPTPPSSESNEEKPESNTNDNDAESSSSSSENEEDDVKTETNDTSDSVSSTETKTIETTEEEVSPPPPPKEKESSNEEKSESPTATEEEVTEHSDESISSDKKPEPKDEPKTDSSASTSDETEEKELSSAKSPDKNEETDATADAPSANAKEASDASVASESDTVQEDTASKEQEATPNDNAESNEEVVAAEKNEENESDQEKPPSVEVSDNEDESKGDKGIPDQEEQTETDTDNKSADEKQSGTKVETSAAEPEEASAAASDAQSESDEKDGER
jgi:hypothetical protein